MPPSRNTNRSKKLSDFDKADIIRRRLSQEKVSDLANEYGVCAKTIRQVCVAAEKENHVPSTGTDATLRKTQKYLNIKDRQDIMKRVESGESPGLLATIYDVSDRTVRRLTQEKQKIEATVKIVDPKKLNSIRKYRTEDGTVEKVLYEWFVQKRAAGEPVTGAVLQEKALIISKSLDQNSTFRASSGWLHRFKQRHGIHTLSFQGEILSADRPSAEAFSTELQELIESENISLDRLYNADETGLFWRSFPKRTLVDGGEIRAPGHKDPKDRITVMFCSNASGTHKIPLFVIGKSKNPRSFKNVRLPITYTATKSAWMTKETFFQWYEEVFIPQVKEYQAEHLEYPQKAYLLLDNAPSHPSAEELNSVDTNFEVIYLPSNVTSIIQPMDQEGIIEKSKRLYKKSCLRELLLERDDEGITKFMKSQNLKDCCNRIANAWEQVTPQNVRNAWKNLLVTGNFQGQKSTNELEVRQTLDLVHRVPRYASLSFDDARRWLDEDCDETGWEVLNAEQILERIQVHLDHYHQQTSDNESSEDEERTRADTELSDSLHMEEQIPTLHEALEGLRTFQKYFETRWECKGEDLQKLQGYRDRVL